MNLNSIRSFKPAGFPSLSTTLPPYNNTVTLLAIAALALSVTYLVCRIRFQQFEVIGPYYKDYIILDPKCVIVTPQNLGSNWINLLHDVLLKAGMDRKSAALLKQETNDGCRVWRRVDNKDFIVMIITDVEYLGLNFFFDTVFIISDKTGTINTVYRWTRKDRRDFDKFVYLQPTSEGIFPLDEIVKVLKKCIQPKNA